MAPGGAWYADRLEGWMNLAHIAGGECLCGELCVVDVGAGCGIVCGESDEVEKRQLIQFV